MLARLLRLFPDLPEAPAIRRVFDLNLQPEKIAAEVNYVNDPAHRTFERTYGWAWLLKFSAELHSSSEADSQRWAVALDPLARTMAARYRDFLPRQTYPIRTGVHPNTAFGIALALDYARAIGDASFEGFLKERARTYFGQDHSYPAAWEPGGEDFLSPALMEAELMRQVLGRREFATWFRRFLPELSGQTQENLLKPAIVADRTDPKLVHLDGLNLSRAWCMKGIASDLPKYHRARKLLQESAEAHLAATLPHIASGNYEGEHWLATFAVLATTEPGSVDARVPTRPK